MDSTLILLVLGLIMFGLFLIFMGVSVRHIPAQPPHIAVVTFFGNRTREIKREGYRFFPFFPLVYNGLLIEMTKRNYNLAPQRVRTRDQAELEISISVTWAPCERYAIEFLDHGGEEGVRGALDAAIRSRLLQWAAAANRDWVRTTAAEDEATVLLIQAVVGLSSQMTSDQQKELIRRNNQGNCAQPISNLGIILNQLNISHMKVLGGLARDAELPVRKRSQIEAENLSLSNLKKQVKELVELGVSIDKAFELVQSERGTVPKNIQRLEGQFSSETLRAISEILGR